jgi:basic amino acid/polyamine antiporter, APA family
MEPTTAPGAGQAEVERLTSAQTDFRRELSLFDGINVVIGNTIGSGIFIAPAVVAATIAPQTGGIHLLVWLVGGLLAMTGALSYAELGALMPRAGGHYVFLREGIGNIGGFLYGWTILLVIASGSIAFVSITFVTYLSYFLPMSAWLIKLLAIITILGLTGVNYVGVKMGSAVLNIFTGLKVIALVVLIIAGLFFASLHREYFLPVVPEGTKLDVVWLSTFMFALVSALFTYGGWQNIGFIAGELKNPRRNLPVSMVIGVTIVIVIYMLTNFVYVNVLSVPMMAGSHLVASDAMEGLWGKLGGSFVALLIMISSFGITNAIIMVSPRVYYAMAKDGLFLPQLARVHPRFKTPHVALVFQAVWASVIVVVSDTFQQIMNYVVFMDWLFLAMAVYCIYLLRKKYPDAPRPYRAWGYPVTPALFILLSMLVVVNTLMRAPLESGIGIAIVLSGLPFYFGMNTWLRRQVKAKAPTLP